MVITTLININRSAKEMHNSHLPALTRINNLESSWQQSIFFLRSYTQHKNPEYYQKAQEYLSQTEHWCSIQKQQGPHETKTLADSISNALQKFKAQSLQVEVAIIQIERNYNKLDSAIANLQNYSNNYLQLQYQKLKNDVDKQEPPHIIKRRADKIELMSQIVSTATQLKTSIGEANFKHNFSLLDSLPASLNLVHNNLAILRPITTKGYDLDAMDAIEDLTDIMQAGQEKTRTLVENLQNIASTIDRLINQLHLRSVKLDKASSMQANNAQSIANNLNAIAQLSETNARNAAKGVVEIKKASSVVATYTQQTKHSLATLQNLMNHSDNIAHLAQQSYILSLNASVEAARDHSSLQSRGFAVIAQNMRTLAENVRDLSQKMSKLSAQGRESSNSTLNQAEEVQMSIQKAIALFSDLSEGAQGQNQAVNNIMNAAEEFNHYSSANTGIATEMAGEAAQLGKLSQQLYRLLEFYQLDEMVTAEKILPLKENNDSAGNFARNQPPWT